MRTLTCSLSTGAELSLLEFSARLLVRKLVRGDRRSQDREGPRRTTGAYWLRSFGGQNLAASAVFAAV
jgi:hypothetical protein